MKYTISIIRFAFLALFIFLITRGMMNLWLILFAISLAIALVFGRLYCGYVFPMNTLMIPTEWLSLKLGLQNLKAPKWLSNGKFGWVMLALSLLSMIFAKRFLGKNIPVLLIWIGLSIIITLRYKPYIFHNLICPFGVVQKLFSKRPMCSERVDADKCNGCTLCERVCPSDAVEVKSESNKAVIDESLCFQCTNCQKICPKNAIEYKTR